MTATITKRCAISRRRSIRNAGHLATGGSCDQAVSTKAVEPVPPADVCHKSPSTGCPVDA